MFVSAQTGRRFLSTPSARRATDAPCRCHPALPFLSTPSARRATGADEHIGNGNLISIHALREEGDGVAPGMQTVQPHFYPRPPRGGRPRVVLIINQFVIISIHALREEGDIFRACPRTACAKFLSTPSARRATLRPAPQPAYRSHFYPRPPRGGRQQTPSGAQRRAIFLSTPSARRATGDARVLRPVSDIISIHALREEGDKLPSARRCRL